MNCKKALSILIMLTMCLACLVGCGQKREPEPPQGGSEIQTGSTLDWSKENITMIVPWNAGAGNDLCARNLAPLLEKELGVSITVVNEPGANGWIGWNDLLSAKADGNTISIMNLPSVFSGYMDPQQNRTENADSFMFVANAVSDWDTIVVRADDDRFTDVASFVEYAMDHEMLSGDPGIGTNMHLAACNMRNEFDGIRRAINESFVYSNGHGFLCGR